MARPYILFLLGLIVLDVNIWYVPVSIYVTLAVILFILIIVAIFQAAKGKK